MGYKFQGICYETLYDMHSAWSDYCHASGSGLGSYFMACKADSAAGSVEIKMLAVSSGVQNGSTWYFNPQQIACDYASNPIFSNADIVEMSWMVVYALSVAFAFRLFYKAV